MAKTIKEFDIDESISSIRAEMHRRFTVAFDQAGAKNDMDLLALYKNYSSERFLYGTRSLSLDSSKNPLRLAAAKAIWEAELASHWEQFKVTTKEAGYVRLYVGAYPGWLSAPKNSIFGIPATPPNTTRLLFYICDILGGASCGNGIAGADQAQLRLLPDALESILGEHIL